QMGAGRPRPDLLAPRAPPAHRTGSCRGRSVPATARPGRRSHSGPDWSLLMTLASSLPRTAGPGFPGFIAHYINGGSVPSRGGATFDVLDPSTNRVYGQAAAGQGADIDWAVTAAQAALAGPWGAMSARE